ncbi:putative membrane protein [Exiguobacterium sp. S17]|nr:putative membrane protein [Exiguobacterium sp. S17]
MCRFGHPAVKRLIPIAVMMDVGPGFLTRFFYVFGRPR